MTPHWLALHLPRLPIEVFGAVPDPGSAAVAAAAPFAVVNAAGSPVRVLLADAAAARCGVRPGLALSAAQVLCPALKVRPRDAAAEDHALERLALWGEQFTPTLCLARSEAAAATDPRTPHDALLLEIGGSLALFGGLEALVARVRDALVPLAHDAVLASAPTPLAALLFARQGLEVHVHDRAALASRLDALPASALDVTPAAHDWFGRVGLRTLAELRRLPRAGLAQRTGGREALAALDRATGHASDPRAPFVPPPRFDTRLELPCAVHEVEALLFAARRLVGALAGFLAGRERGLLRGVLQLGHRPQSGVPAATSVGLVLSSPNRDPLHLARLLHERLSRTPLPASVETLRLVAVETAPLASRSLSFLDARGGAVEERLALVEQLRARLGPDAVHGVALAADHRPERAWQRVEPGARRDVAVTTSRSPLPPPRPFWLLDPPRPWQPTAGTRWLAGPERIESGWWDADGDMRRDYHVVEIDDGRRAWVWRSVGGHAGGEAGGGTADAQWWLHGWFG
jgi:protein ImuB